MAKGPATHCKCNTLPDGTIGACDRITSSSFAQGHDARLSSRVAKAIAAGTQTMDQGLAEVRELGGGDLLISKTRRSAELRASRPASKGGKTPKCAQCGKRAVNYRTQGKDSTMCRPCFEYAGWENTHNDNDHANRGPIEGCPVCQNMDPAGKREPAPSDDAAETPADTVQETVRVKVGRWVYDATINHHGDAMYEAKGGEQKIALSGTYKVV